MIIFGEHQVFPWSHLYDDKTLILIIDLYSKHQQQYFYSYFAKHLWSVSNIFYNISREISEMWLVKSITISA